jgi:hypothetical protein
MGWQEAFRKRGRHLARDAVRVGVSGGRSGFRIRYVFGSDVVQRMKWKSGTRLIVRWGTGEHFGHVQLCSDARGWTLKPPGGAINGSLHFEIAELPTFIRRRAMPVTDAEWSVVGEGVLQLKLPAGICAEPRYEDDPRALREPAGKRIGHTPVPEKRLP